MKIWDMKEREEGTYLYSTFNWLEVIQIDWSIYEVDELIG